MEEAQRKPVIRPFATKEEMAQVAVLEKAVWGMDATPVHQLYTAVKNGGILLGAFDRDRAVGFQYSFAGFDGNRAYLCSHMLGILPEYRHSGLGADMKRVQASIARNLGYDLVRWTFDPLESRNAYLNIRKLGGVVGTYIENCYGEMTDELNAGLPTDRFEVDWWVRGQRVTDGLRAEPAEPARPFEINLTGAGLPVLEADRLVLPESRAFSVPVPARFQELKKSDAPLALDWRLKTRELFLRAFENGYVLEDVERRDEKVNEYVLRVKDEVPLG
ncbi:GNAT family N-acetyltransferase [Bhargavaea ullalensis]|uniref:GNAT superfamily acetyltransferase n=1 Tax=Bhargavaea ullalensis TaxID=1265685 RepID=A0ABV2G9L5_9BACL